jgi:hypothetical protein
LNGFGIIDWSSEYTILPVLSNVLKDYVFHTDPKFEFGQSCPVHLSEVFTHGDSIAKCGEAAMLNYGNVEAVY